MELANGFGKRLTELQDYCGATDGDIAAAAFASRESVRKWKNGESCVSFTSLVKLAVYFKVSVDYLLGTTDDFTETEIADCPPFYERLRKVMREKNVTRYRLVKETGVYDGYFTNWKRGALPRVVTLIKLAEYLGVTVGYLIGTEK